MNLFFDCEIVDMNVWIRIDTKSVDALFVLVFIKIAITIMCREDIN
jgi:hypothetical protein